jgi:hypothetical protein
MVEGPIAEQIHGTRSLAAPLLQWRDIGIRDAQ